MLPKYQKLADVLRSSIQDGTYRSQKALPTEQALCRQFQVSRQTVRQALALLESEGLIERRQGSGSYVRDRSQPVPQQRRSVAVVTTYISDYIFPEILREIESVLSENNGTPLLFSTQNRVVNERKVLKTLLELDALDGVLVEGTKTGLPNPNLDLYRSLMERGVPLVFFHGNYPELTGTVSIMDDNYGGGRMLVEHLYKKGRRRIAGIFKSDDIQGHQRYAGYAAALREYGLPLDDGNVLWYATEHMEYFFKRPIAGEWIDQVLDGCAAVICYNDEIAGRLISYLSRKGVAVPGDLSVVSFDNSRYSEVSVPRITSLSHGSSNVGRLAAQALFRLLEGEPCQSQLVPWTLVQKESG